MTFTEIKEHIARMQSQLDAIRKGGVPEDYYHERLALTDAAQDSYDLAVAVYNNMISRFASKASAAASSASSSTALGHLTGP